MMSISTGSDPLAPPISPAALDLTTSADPAPATVATTSAEPKASDPATYVAQVALLQCRDLVDRLLRRNDLEGLMRVQRAVAAEVSATEAQVSPWRAGTGVRPGLSPRIMASSAGISPGLLLFMPPSMPPRPPPAPPLETISELAPASPASAAEIGPEATAAVDLPAQTQCPSDEKVDTVAEANSSKINFACRPPAVQRPPVPQPSPRLVADVTERLAAEKRTLKDGDLISRLSAVLDFWAGVSTSSLHSRYGLSMQLIRRTSHILLTQGLPDYLILPRRTRNASLRQAKRPASPLGGPSNPSER